MKTGKLMIGAALVLLSLGLSGTELLTQENSKNWNFRNPEVKIGPAGVSIPFQGKLQPGVSRLDVKQNENCMLVLTYRLTPGAKMFFYVENHTGKNWQNKALNLVGNGKFKTVFLNFKFTKPVQGNTYSVMRLNGKGTLDIKSLILIKGDNMNDSIFNADFSAGDTGWSLEKNAALTKNKKDQSVLELQAKQNDTARATTAPVLVTPLRRYRLSYNVFGVTGFGKASIEHDLRMYPMDKRGEPLAGTAKWLVCLDGRTQTKFVEFQVPARHNEITFALETRGPARVQFSDFKLEPIPEKKQIAEIRLDPPFNYRDGVFHTNPAKKITGEAVLIDPAAVSAELTLTFEGNTLGSQKITKSDRKFALPVPPEGKSSDLTLTVRNAAGKTIFTEKKAIHNYSLNPVEVTFRDDGVTLVNGKPFFHIGNWWFTKRGDRDEDLEFLKEAGFNVILLPNDHPDRFPMLDLVKRHGLYGVIELPHRYEPNLKTPQAKAGFKKKWTNLIRKNIDHPALFGYFGPDEGMLAGYQIETMEEFYNLARDNDPYHPLWYNEAPVGQVSDLAAYAKNTCDVFGVDIYPLGAPHGTDLGDRSMTVVGKHTDRCVQAVENRKPVWMILQGFSWIHMRKPARFKPASEVPDAQYPTWEQTRFMAYNSILHGATGIQYHYLGYTVHVPDEFWKGIRRTTLELKYLTPVLTARTVKNPPMKCDQAKVRMMVKKFEGKFYYLLINESPDALTAKFSAFPEKKLNILYGKQPVDVKDGAFELKLEPYAVRVMSEDSFPDSDIVWQKATYRPYSAKLKDDVRK
ncbi:MAG: hypothetical protein J5806_05955 [Lentisphaeria bacterium]|nr:hypothetical protein [Lentisphaeria bacterium]